MLWALYYWCSEARSLSLAQLSYGAKDSRRRATNKGRTTTRDPLATLSLVFCPSVCASYSYSCGWLRPAPNSCLCMEHADNKVYNRFATELFGEEIWHSSCSMHSAHLHRVVKQSLGGKYLPCSSELMRLLSQNSEKSFLWKQCSCYSEFSR